jgi:PAS domain S-box-containing protein
METMLCRPTEHIDAPFVAADYVELFFDLFEDSSDLVYLTRLSDGTVLDANDSALDAFGLQRGLAIGRTTTELGIWVDRHARCEYLDAVRVSGRVKGYVARMRDYDRREFTVSMSGNLVRLRGEEVVLGVGRVITG